MPKLHTVQKQINRRVKRMGNTYTKQDRGSEPGPSGTDCLMRAHSTSVGAPEYKHSDIFTEWLHLVKIGNIGINDDR